MVVVPSQILFKLIVILFWLLVLLATTDLHFHKQNAECFQSLNRTRLLESVNYCRGFSNSCKNTHKKHYSSNWPVIRSTWQTTKCWETRRRPSSAGALPGNHRAELLEGLPLCWRSSAAIHLYRSLISTHRRLIYHTLGPETRATSNSQCFICFNHSVSQ